MDTMTLVNADGTKEEIEIVVTFKIKEFNDNDYVIYKNNDDFFGARYIEENDNVDLITDLSKEEQKAMSEIFEKLRKGEVINA